MERLSYARGDDSVDDCDVRGTGQIPLAELKQILISALSVFNEDAISCIFHELSRNGMDLDNPSASYSLSQLEEHLRKMFGQEGADWVVDRIRKGRKLKD